MAAIPFEVSVRIAGVQKKMETHMKKKHEKQQNHVFQAPKIRTPAK